MPITFDGEAKPECNRSYCSWYRSPTTMIRSPLWFAIIDIAVKINRLESWAAARSSTDNHENTKRVGQCRSKDRCLFRGVASNIGLCRFNVSLDSVVFYRFSKCVTRLSNVTIKYRSIHQRVEEKVKIGMVESSFELELPLPRSRVISSDADLSMVTIPRIT